MTDKIIVCGKSIQYDNSGGQGHAWIAANEDNCHPGIQEEIAAEIIDGGLDECDDFTGSNGQHYRW